jgi:hypothetical protein
MDKVTFLSKQQIVETADTVAELVKEIMAV